VSELFDQAARSAPGTDEAHDRLVKWLVGERLACVLLLEDSSLAFRLAEQGHEVVVAGEDVRTVRSSDVLYVRTVGPRLPFVADAFDAVVAPQLQDDQTVLAEYARVLRPDGVLSTLARSHDETLPWVRRLREVAGRRPEPPAPASDTLAASGLFHPAETAEHATWAELDLPALLQFTRETGRPPVEDATLSRVRELFDQNTAQSGSLRLRNLLRGVRARVRKSPRPAGPQHPDTLLLDLR
jgi:SAM-dependent methyltransferase